MVLIVRLGPEAAVGVLVERRETWLTLGGDTGGTALGLAPLLCLPWAGGGAGARGQRRAAAWSELLTSTSGLLLRLPVEMGHRYLHLHASSFPSTGTVCCAPCVRSRAPTRSAPPDQTPGNPAFPAHPPESTLILPENPGSVC